MDADPARRYQTALAFAGALEGATSDESIPVVAAAPAHPGRRQSPAPPVHRASRLLLHLSRFGDDLVSERDLTRRITS